jgi:hypothetical protein
MFWRLVKPILKGMAGLKLQALILFTCYAVYILIYNIPSAVGFFVMEIDTQEQAAAKVEIVDTINRQKLSQINQTIDNLNRQLEREADTGFGERSKAVMEQLSKLSAEQFKLRESFSETSDQTSKTLKVSKNVFGSLEKVLKVSANLLKVVIFGTSIAMLCLILIITSWDVKIDIPDAPMSQREISSETDKDKVMAVMGKMADAVEAGQEEPLTDSGDQDKAELITYVNAAIRDTGKLNGNGRIAEQTGLPLSKCEEFKSWLIEQGLIRKGQGASVANFPKEIILEKVQVQV